MIKGRLSIFGEVEIDGDKHTGAFVECSVDELKAGRMLFGEMVRISATKQPDAEDTNHDGCEQCAVYHEQGMYCRNCGNTVPAVHNLKASAEATK